MTKVSILFALAVVAFGLSATTPIWVPIVKGLLQ